MQTYKFRIAELNIRIVITNDAYNGMKLMPSMQPFIVDEHDDELFFQLIVDDSLAKVPETECRRIRTFDTGNGDIIVDKLENDQADCKSCNYISTYGKVFVVGFKLLFLSGTFLGIRSGLPCVFW